MVGSFRNLTDASKIDRAPKRAGPGQGQRRRRRSRPILKRSGHAGEDRGLFAVMNGLELAARASGRAA
ncbi:MAG: hypothetical protein M0C28_00775 [Candidatus Moduliflexus flocculans]|nr:hypothetical protein [Candidatus Moduliflexus flocculans]